MKRIKKFTEAIETECQTPGCKFKTDISDNKISVEIDLPKSLDLNEEEAKLLESNIHNALELVFAKYF